MSPVILDDHLLRDMLADELSDHLATFLADNEPATTNLYYVRLCRSVVSARGGRLTGAWSSERRRALGRTLLTLPETIMIVPMRSLAFRMAELAAPHRLSALGAEAVASAEHLSAPLCVWEGDDGPHIRAAARAVGATYHTVSR